ncbi:putative WD repeat-containing protein C17D11.08 [Erysiphe neolycopersici]|uniref:Putative WD repeat-containing protein C17D11.08 n=1 Tax=Erysiphe neolycopersici TaxID=212602 RepID=A0A420I085_9PEZI|nr:putative WD repeat-containing protein C17D11.08 [Erysiphe neolycopersici]
MASQRSTLFPKEFAPSNHRNSIDQAAFDASQCQNIGQQIPGSLQPGRVGSISLIANNSLSPSQNVPKEHRLTPTRSIVSGFSQNQNQTRTSPSGLDGNGYLSFAPKTPVKTEKSQFPGSTSQKYTPQSSQRAFSITPLGLADIRPRAGSGVSENTSETNTHSHDATSIVPKICNYIAPWAVYAFDWCKWPVQGQDAGKAALGSYLEDSQNFIQVLDSQVTQICSEKYSPETPKFGLKFVKIAEASHSYPVTRLLWEPPSSQKQSTDLLATSGDHLRLWSLPSEAPIISQDNSITKPTNNRRDSPVMKLTPLALLSNSKTPEHTAPLTSLDWNIISPSLIITSSIDTTCTIWDIPTLTAKTQLIAHDKEVFDVRFCANSVDVFVSCGADGSVRMFDLRSLEHSTIIYEPTSKNDKDNGSGKGRISPTLAQQTMSYAPPLLRLAASPHDAHLLATFSQDSKLIYILDVRQPGQALLELKGHVGAVNCIEWSPSRRGTLASGADDSLVLIWDLFNQHNTIIPSGSGLNGGHISENCRGPSASWQCDYEVCNTSWAPQSSINNEGAEWLGVSSGRGIWGVKL